MTQHLTYLALALENAASRRGFCAPNPAVGAVVVKDGRIVATGTHWASGSPHAEVAALDQLSVASSRGATLYVTLEPCCHWGKTPPCTQKIIASGVTKVYYGLVDPNPQMAGRGAAELQAAGIHCEQVSVESINAFYRSYCYWQQTKKPWVTAKIASSLDGKIAAAEGKPLPITGQELQQHTHLWRKRSDAILTTVRTIINDDPQMNARWENETYAKPLYLLDSHLALPLTAKICQTAKKITVFHQANASIEKKQRLQNKGMECVAVQKSPSGLDLTAILQHIGNDGMQDLWVEAGGKCFLALLAEGLVQQAFIYLSLKIFGKNARTITEEFFPDLFANAETIQWQGFGRDGVCALTFPPREYTCLPV